jgi:hypothetical protein
VRRAAHFAAIITMLQRVVHPQRQLAADLQDDNTPCNNDNNWVGN